MISISIFYSQAHVSICIFPASPITLFPNLAASPGSNVSAVLTAVYKTNPVRYPVKKVIRTKFITTPCVIGFFSPIVFLPDLDFTQEELYCILYHEISHLRHMDFIWMLLAEVLCIINWWNPFLILLRTQLKDIMEFHADNTTFSNLPSTYRDLYLDCLIKVSRSQQKKAPLPVMTLPFFKNSPSSLKRRILRLVNPESYRSVVNFLTTSIAILLLIVSTLFIIEPSWMPDNGMDNEYYITENSYLLMLPDGTYRLYIDDEHCLGTIKNPNVEEIRNLPIYYIE